MPTNKWMRHKFYWMWWTIEHEDSNFSYSKQKTSDLPTTHNKDNLKDAQTLQLTEIATQNHKIPANMFDCCFNSPQRILFYSVVVYFSSFKRRKCSNN